jgi:hypothetical protein
MGKKFFLILCVFLFLIKSYAQNSPTVEQSPDAILLSKQVHKSPEDLKSLISKAEQQKAVDKIMNDTKAIQKDEWGDALKEQENKQKSEEYKNISQDDLYEDLSDGTRRAKYPFVPAGANTIEDVEKYFKEHPSEMTSDAIKPNKSSNDSSSTYSESLSESNFRAYGIIASVVICFIIAEVFGRSRHIGRWWSFFLLLCGFIPGIIALINSPSAKNNPTQGGKSHYIWAYVFLVFGVLNAIILITSKGQTGYLSFIFFTLSFYLFELKKGLIINKTPRYYI